MTLDVVTRGKSGPMSVHMFDMPGRRRSVDACHYAYTITWQTCPDTSAYDLDQFELVWCTATAPRL